MEDFSEILKELISETKMSLRQLMLESGVTAMQYSRYLKGCIPTINIAIKIAKYFNCSLDYLFGLSSNKVNNKYKTYNYDISKFITNYQKLLKQNNLTHFIFIRTGGYDESIIRHWKRGSIPRLDVVYFIAKNLSGSIDELIGRY